MVKALIFDLWGTVIETGVRPSPSRQVKYLLRVDAPFPDFILAFEHSFMTKKFDSLQEAFENVVQDFNLKIPDFVYEKLVGMWNKNAILSKFFEETEEVLKALKEKGIKLFLIANIDQFSYAQIKDKFKLEEYFDKVYLSYETGLLKVNEDSFKLVLKENKLKTTDVMMIGDSLDSDMKAAEQAKIKGVLIDRKGTREFDNKISSLKELMDKI